MCEKRKNGAKYVCEVLKCIDLNKLQRCNERVSQDEESLERHKDSLSNKRSSNSLHSSQEKRTGSMQIELQITLVPIKLWAFNPIPWSATA